METNPRPFWMTAIQALSLVVFAVLSALFLVDLVTGLRSPINWLSAIAAIPIGYLAADLASGLVHWFCDSFLAVDTPLLGRLIIHPFREHHRDPMLMTRHDFIEVNGNVCLALAPVLATGWWLGNDLGGGPLASFLHGAFAAFLVAIFATNQIHFWVHSEQRPRFVGWLQKRDCILSPRRHAKHHQPGHGAAYCITSGWMNPVMDSRRLWDVCERVVATLGIPRAG
ncbi:MAG: kua-ubiquitin conjugating enzyme hybrid localization domain protein [Acidobacteria bacterium]|nr:kua-ubiquitin conjugating enzyme hybrid localization domain protein [Acidobacteriota bacterium]